MRDRRTARQIDRTPWQPLRYVTPYDTLESVHYNGRDHWRVACAVTEVITRMMEKPEGPFPGP